MDNPCFEKPSSFKAGLVIPVPYQKKKTCKTQRGLQIDENTSEWTTNSDTFKLEENAQVLVGTKKGTSYDGAHASSGFGYDGRSCVSTAGVVTEPRVRIPSDRPLGGERFQHLAVA